MTNNIAKSRVLCYNQSITEYRKPGNWYQQLPGRYRVIEALHTMTDSTALTKVCTGCQREFPATTEYFHKQAIGKYGLHAQCKLCHAVYRAVHREESVVYGELYRANHREEERARSKTYKAAHREESAVQKKGYRASRREEIAAYDSAYRMAHPDKVRAKSKRRRTLEHALPFCWTAADEAHGIDYWNNRCAYCECPLPQLKLFGASGIHFDHYIPLADARPDNPGTTPKNMLPVCAECNLSKKHTDPIAWLTRKFGARKAKKIIARIETYFKSLKIDGEP